MRGRRKPAPAGDSVVDGGTHGALGLVAGPDTRAFARWRGLVAAARASQGSRTRPGLHALARCAGSRRWPRRFAGLACALTQCSRTRHGLHAFARRRGLALHDLSIIRRPVRTSALRSLNRLQIMLRQNLIQLPQLASNQPIHFYLQHIQLRRKLFEHDV
jgi:hypothetical protein